MEQSNVVAPRRRQLTAYARALRRARIFSRLRDGWAHDDIARDEGLSTKRVRQILSQALDRRPVGDDELHARMQMERLLPALQAPNAELAEGDIRAIRPLLKVLDQLDRYHKLVARRPPKDDHEPVAEAIDEIAATLQSLSARPDDPALEARTGAALADAGSEQQKNVALARCNALKRNDCGSEREQNARP